MTAFTPTPQQRAVIEHGLSPLRVAAGAGSGKTGTMALRLAHHVGSGEVEPEQALGITFTNKAAAELADRIRAVLPETTAQGREVEVTTYHGFAHAILREFGPLVGIPREVRIVTPGYTRQMIRDAIARAPSPLLDLTQAGRVVDAVAHLSTALSDQLLDPEAVVIGGEDEVTAERAALLAVVVEYEEIKRRNGIVDFGDLVAMAHRIVTEHEDVASRIGDRFRLVLLDEYQDTNPAQRELLRAIFPPGFPITAVGDTDQTIYEWRGASPHNFEDFGSHFPLEGGGAAPSLDLSVSWRNDRLIVTAANEIRDRLAVPGPLPELQPRPRAGEGAIVTHWARSAEAEAAWIADEVEALHQGGTSWNQMAILFRKHSPMAAVRDALVDRGIPVEVASLGGLLQVPEVVELHSWLRVLGRPDDAVALARILTGAHYRLGLGDLVPLVTWLRSRRPAADEEEELGWALLEAVDELPDISALSDRARTRLDRFRALYRELLVIAQGVSLVELCRIVLDRIGAWLEVEALEDAARLSTKLNLFRFLDLAEEWSPIEGAPSLTAFLDHLDLLADEAASGELDTARVSGEDAVPLLTVHRAKGLEWDVVFLPALAHNVFPGGVIRYPDPLRVPSVLPYHLRLDRDSLPDLPDDDDERKALLRRAHDDQEWRTAYVATTRARHRLYGSGAFWTGGKKPRDPSALFEILDALAEPAPGRADEPGQPPERRPVATTPDPDPVFADGWRSALRRTGVDPSTVREVASRLGVEASYDRVVEQMTLELSELPTPRSQDHTDQPFMTSVTGLVTLAVCPLRFRWSEIDRLPRRPSGAARHGVELHRRIELHNRGSVGFAEASSDFYDDIGPATGARGGGFTRFLESRFADRRPALIEAPFTLDTGNGRVSGRIDAVYRDGDAWEIVDFKSGRAASDPARRVQLQAYAVALDEARMTLDRPESLTATFVYLGGDELEEVSEAVDDDWLTQARARISELLEAATGAEHPATPGPACRHCDFSHLCDPGRAWIEEHR